MFKIKFLVYSANPEKRKDKHFSVRASLPSQCRAQKLRLGKDWLGSSCENVDVFQSRSVLREKSEKSERKARDNVTPPMIVAYFHHQLFCHILRILPHDEAFYLWIVVLSAS